MNSSYMKKRNTMHVLHLILTILIWPWVIIWVICAVSNSRHNNAVDSEREHQRHNDLMTALTGRDKSINLPIYDPKNLKRK